MARCRRFHSALLCAALLVDAAAARAEPRAEPPASKTDEGAYLRFSGYVQAIGVVFDQSSLDEVDPSTGDPLNDTQFAIRRGRLRTTFGYRFAFAEIELDVNTVLDSNVRVTRAMVGLHWGERSRRGRRWPLLELRAGLLRTPFGRDVQHGSRGRPFLERSNVADALFPGSYDVGVELRGQWRFLRYQLAATNGSPIGDRVFPLVDPSASKDIVGRLGVVSEHLPRARIEAGVSLLFGHGLSPGVPSTKDSVQWVDANENGVVELSELVPVAGTAGRASETFTRRAIGADLSVRVELPRVGALTLFGEIIASVNLDRAQLVADPVLLGRDLRELGFSIGLTQRLFDWFVVGARYDRYDPDADANEQAPLSVVPLDRSVATLALVAGWTPWPWAMLAVEYDHNDNNFGRSADGSPARLKNDRLLFRLQVSR